MAKSIETKAAPLFKADKKIGEGQRFKITRISRKGFALPFEYKVRDVLHDDEVINVSFVIEKAESTNNEASDELLNKRQEIDEPQKIKVNKKKAKGTMHEEAVVAYSVVEDKHEPNISRKVSKVEEQPVVPSADTIERKQSKISDNGKQVNNKVQEKEERKEISDKDSDYLEPEKPQNVIAKSNKPANKKDKKDNLTKIKINAELEKPEKEEKGNKQKEEKKQSKKQTEESKRSKPDVEKKAEKKPANEDDDLVFDQDAMDFDKLMDPSKKTKNKKAKADAEIKKQDASVEVKKPEKYEEPIKNKNQDKKASQTKKQTEKKKETAKPVKKLSLQSDDKMFQELMAKKPEKIKPAANNKKNKHDDSDDEDLMNGKSEDSSINDKNVSDNDNNSSVEKDDDEDSFDREFQKKKQKNLFKAI